MKIALPVDSDPNILCVTLGRALHFAIYNTETGTTELKKNPAAQAQGGAGLKVAQFIIDNQADVVITSRCGKNSADALKAAGVQIYQSAGLSVKQNIADWKDGKLALMENFMAGQHKGQ